MFFASFSDSFKYFHTADTFAALVRKSIWLRHVVVRYNLFGLFAYSQFRLPNIRCIPTCNPKVVNNQRSLHPQYHDSGETLEQGTEPPTVPWVPQQYGCPLCVFTVCSLLCVCAFGWVKCRAQIPSMGRHRSLHFHFKKMIKKWYILFVILLLCRLKLITTWQSILIWLFF